jgi:hypothetical protein
MPSQILTERKSQKGGRKGKKEEGCNRERVRYRGEKRKEVTKGRSKEAHTWVSKSK